jgi:glycine/D-amino acid oxidase-like deaminating enzyme
MSLSLWEKESFYAPADIIIAGSGFVGLWSAYYLKKKQPKLRITIIERGAIPTGASTRNAGFACFGSATELIRDAQTMGEDQMLSLVEMRYKGLKRIRKTFRKKQIGFSKCGGYELISSANDGRYNELSEAVKWLNRALRPILDTKKTFRFDDDAIAEFGFNGIGHIIANDLEGSLHPGKLCQLLLTTVQGMGVTVLAGTEITRFEDSPRGVSVFTDQHIELRCDCFLICTNGFAKQLLPELQMVPGRGQILVTAPIPSLKIRGTFHYDEGFYYFRNVGDRLLLGGARNTAIEEETTTEMRTSPKIQDRLEEFMSEHLLPGIPFEITDRWSGIMGMGAEKMPIVKKLSSNMYCAVRMSGMGVALAPIAGETVSELMLG